MFVVAPFISRVERIAERLGIGLQKASEVVQECDDDRRAYTFAVARCDGSDPLLYDLVINTDQLSVDAAAELILTAARRSGVLGAGPAAERATSASPSRRGASYPFTLDASAPARSGWTNR